MFYLQNRTVHVPGMKNTAGELFAMPRFGHYELSSHGKHRVKRPTQMPSSSQTCVVQLTSNQPVTHSSVFRGTVILLQFMLVDSTQPHWRKCYLGRLEILLCEKKCVVISASPLDIGWPPASFRSHMAELGLEEPQGTTWLPGRSCTFEDRSNGVSFCCLVRLLNSSEIRQWKMLCSLKEAKARITAHKCPMVSCTTHNTKEHNRTWPKPIAALLNLSVLGTGFDELGASWWHRIQALSVAATKS